MKKIWIWTTFLAGMAAVIPFSEIHAEDWEVTLSPYAWLAGVDAEVSIGERTVDAEIEFDDILDDYCNEAYGPAALDMKSFYLIYEDRI